MIFFFIFVSTGYTGVHCEVDIGECASNPCLYSGLWPICSTATSSSVFRDSPERSATSILTIASALPIRTAVYVGIPSPESPPYHHGDCVDRINFFACQCHPGYNGLLCQTQINDCESLLLRRSPRGSHWRLPVQMVVNECFINPCRTEATCIDG